MRSKIDIKCDNCFNNFIVEDSIFKYRKKKGQQHFCCGKKCRLELRQKQKMEEVQCIYCGSLFKRNKKVRRLKKCCSAICCARYSRSFKDNEKSRDLFIKTCHSNESREIRRLKIIAKRKYKECVGCSKKIFGSKKYCSMECLLKNPSSRASSISDARKKRFENGSLSVTGGTTKWFDYKNIRVQGTYELRTCLILDLLKDKKLIKDWRKSNIRIKYIGIDSKTHNYLVDFEIVTKSGKILLLEVKGYKKDNDLLKWKAAKENGHKILIWMIKNIELIENKLKIVLER